MLKNARSLEYITGIGISAAAFTLYLFTLAPTLNFIDSGELAAVSSTLGIAHPTGYPLFTLIGWIFAHLPIGMREIYQLNLMSALLCSVGLFFFFRFLVYLLGGFLISNEENRGRGKLTEMSAWLIFGGAAVGTLILGFSETYWSTALSIEVYSLHILFLSVVLLLFTKAIQSEVSDKFQSVKYPGRIWLAFSLVLGLSFTNHMTTILLAPGFLYLYFSVHGFSVKGFRRILALVIPFLVGFSLYIYLPVRASAEPIFNWGNPADLERFLWHLSAKQYRVWIFSSTESAGRQLNYFFNTLIDKFGYLPMVFAIIGVVSTISENLKALTGLLFFHLVIVASVIVAIALGGVAIPFLTVVVVAAGVASAYLILIKFAKANLFVYIFLLFESCVTYAVNYDIHDIDSYFLLAYVAIAAWAALGAFRILQSIKVRTFLRVVSIICLASTMLLIAQNIGKVDQSRNYIVENYAKDLLRYIEPDGIILSFQWDYFISASYYLQAVENYRTDVIVIDKELLRRSWYFKQLSYRNPWLIDQSKKEIDEFLSELYKFEHGTPYNPGVIEYRYKQVIQSFIRKNYLKRAVYVTPEVEENYTSGFGRVPSGLAFRLYSDTYLREIPYPEFSPVDYRKKDKYVDGIKLLYAKAYTSAAFYFSLIGRKDSAARLADKAIQFRPDLSEAVYLKGQLQKSR